MQCKNNLFIILTPNNKLFFFNLEIVAVPCFAKSWYCYSTEGPYCSALGFGVFSFPLVHISSFLLPCTIVTPPLQGSMSHMSYLQHVAHTFVISYSSHELYQTVKKLLSSRTSQDKTSTTERDHQVRAGNPAGIRNPYLMISTDCLSSDCWYSSSIPVRCYIYWSNFPSCKWSMCKFSINY